jgi:predicted nucleic acid-binding protein
MIVLDACVLIAHLDGRDHHHAAARALLEGSGARPLGASGVTLAETLVSPARVERLDQAWASLERLGVAELPLGPEGPRRLAALRAETGLKLPDCCVLLAAQRHDGVIASFDRDLTRAADQLEIEVVA